MSEFLTKAGSAGPVGALMDEYARAAGDFCRVVETFDQERFDTERESDDKDTVSVREICRHVGGAAVYYAIDLNKALERPADRPFDARARIHTPGDVRSVLVDALRYTEQAAEPLRSMADEEVEKLTFRVSWGTLYNPEILLEHAIVHLLRHRRQLERW